MDRLYKTELAIEVMPVKLTSLKRLPLRATPGAAGYDLQADADITLHVGEIIKVPTGVSLEIPEGFEGQVRSRSGLASKGVIVVNSPGTIDSDYRGEIQVLLMSLKNTHEVKKGDRIAQLVFAPVVRVELFKSVSCLDETERNAGGFGSTGSQSLDEENLAEARERRLLELDTERAGKYLEEELEGEFSVSNISGTFTVKDEET